MYAFYDVVIKTIDIFFSMSSEDDTSASSCSHFRSPNRVEYLTEIVPVVLTAPSKVTVDKLLLFIEYIDYFLGFPRPFYYLASLLGCCIPLVHRCCLIQITGLGYLIL